MTAANAAAINRLDMRHPREKPVPRSARNIGMIKVNEPFLRPARKLDISRYCAS
jgi:hypothetical protein